MASAVGVMCAIALVSAVAAASSFRFIQLLGSYSEPMRKKDNKTFCIRYHNALDGYRPNSTFFGLLRICSAACCTTCHARSLQQIKQMEFVPILFFCSFAAMQLRQAPINSLSVCLYVGRAFEI